MKKYTSYTKAMKETEEVWLEQKSQHSIKPEIFKIPNLVSLDIQYVWGTKETKLPENLGEAAKLRRLTISASALAELPESIGELAELETLTIASSQLTALPASISKLTKLRSLYIADQSYDGKTEFKLPEDFGKLKSLETIVFDRVDIRSLPESFGELSNLRSFEVKFGKLTKLPKSFGNCTALKKIKMERGSLGSLPDNFGLLVALEELSLEKNKLKSLCDNFGGLVNLTKLYLQENQLEILPESIGKCKQLSTISLENNKLTGLPESIGNLHKITNLDLSGNQLETLPASFRQLTGIYNLKLNQNKLATIPEEIFYLQRLHYLEAEGNQLEEIDPRISQLTDFHWLNVRSNQLRALPIELTQLPIEYLYTSDNRFSLAKPPQVYALLKNLKSLTDTTLFNYQVNKMEVSDFIKLTRWMTEQKLDDQQRLHYVNLWWNIEDFTSAEIPTAIYFQARRLPLEKYASYALDCLTKQSSRSLHDNPPTQESEIAVPIKTKESKTKIKQKLKAIGVSYSGKITNKTTHIVIDSKFHFPADFTDYDRYAYLTESQLAAYISRQQPEYLTEKTTEAKVNLKKVQELVDSATDENWAIALGLMQGGGIPEELRTDLFAIHKAADDPKLRSKAGKMLRKVVSQKLLLGLKKRPNLLQSLRTSKGDVNHYRFSYDFAPYKGTEIDLGRFARILMRKI